LGHTIMFRYILISLCLAVSVRSLALERNAAVDDTKKDEYEDRKIHINKRSIFMPQSSASFSLVESPNELTMSSAYARTDIECAVQGSNYPRIEWLKDGQLLNNEIDDDSLDLMIDSAVLVKVKSALVIPCSYPSQSGVYTCVGDDGVKRISGTTELHVDESSSNSIMTEVCSESSSEPVILQWTRTYLGNQGSVAILLCRGPGNKSWFRSSNKSLNNSRYKVLHNGDLMISDLDWRDMGDYTCEVTLNDQIYQLTAFVYPMKRQ